MAEVVEVAEVAEVVEVVEVADLVELFLSLCVRLLLPFFFLWLAANCSVFWFREVKL
jgi:hypothetical protein